MRTSECTKCGGSGRLAHFARIDGGKCWACTDKADTSYTQNVVELSDEEAAARWQAVCEARKVARRQRKELAYCDQPHPGSDAEAANWHRMYHR